MANNSQDVMAQLVKAQEYEKQQRAEFKKVLDQLVQVREDSVSRSDFNKVLEELLREKEEARNDAREQLAQARNRELENNEREAVIRSEAREQRNEMANLYKQLLIKQQQAQPNSIPIFEPIPPPNETTQVNSIPLETGEAALEAWKLHYVQLTPLLNEIEGFAPFMLPRFYGYIPDDNNLRVTGDAAMDAWRLEYAQLGTLFREVEGFESFMLLLFNNLLRDSIYAIHNLSLSVGCAMFALADMDLLFSFVGGEIAVYLGVKLLRGDFMCFVRTEGFVGVLASFGHHTVIKGGLN
ncbi:hypothetical protein ScalyP_jg4790 [Parmales sp. scaly parma]|nr:hypothetical protein ScalyP_jg4790 [Parmales sp. scaly parma]